MTTEEIVRASFEDLESRSKVLEERIEILRREPATRRSAAGGMIQEAHTIREWENKDEELGKIRGEIKKRTDTSGKRFFVIYYGHRHIIPCEVENGILISGGLLDYFKGRPYEEHSDYVRWRHNKQITEIKSIELIATHEKLQAVFNMNGKVVTATSEYKITHDNDTYFYIELLNKEIKNDSYRGLSRSERGITDWILARAYQIEYAPHKHINM